MKQLEVKRNEPDGKLGVAFAGPATSIAPKTGVFIRKIQPGSHASTLKGLVVGMRVLKINGIVRGFFRQRFTLEDAVGSHACSLEALACVQPMAFLSGAHSSYRVAL
jgi:hypothetical protein